MDPGGEETRGRTGLSRKGASESGGTKEGHVKTSRQMGMGQINRDLDV